MALFLCELVAGLLTCLFVCWFGRLFDNQIGAVGAAKLVEAVPLTKVTQLT